MRTLTSAPAGRLYTQAEVDELVEKATAHLTEVASAHSRVLVALANDRHPGPFAPRLVTS